MKIALLHNHFDRAKLMGVMAEMEILGAPTIRIVHVMDDIYQAIEGCHRLRAAAALGITPCFDEIDNDVLISECEGLDYEGDCSGSDPVSAMGDWENTQLFFEE